jgi:hypothetical protein
VKRIDHLNHAVPSIHPARAGFLLALILLLASALPGAQTGVFLDDSVADFSQGDVTTSTLTSQGIVRLPYLRERLGDVDADVVWDVEEIGKRRIIATGHKGLVFTQEGDKPAKVLAELKQAAVYALDQDSKGNTLAATSPGGIVYTIDKDGKSAPFAHTGAGIVWDLVRTEKALVAATGSPASLIRVADDGTTTTLVKVKDVLNILDVAAVPGTSDLVIATQGPGWIARVDADGKLLVLVDPEQEEVRRVVVLSDGSIVGAVNGLRSPGQKLLAKTPDEGKPQGSQKPRPESFLVRIDASGFAREWWVSPESPIHDICTDGEGRLIVAAGANGNIYRVTESGDTDRLGIADEDFITRLAPAADGRILLGTGATAALYELDLQKHATGIYESRVFDAKGSARWARLRALATEAGGEIKVAVRTGNTIKPDNTWGDWSKPRRFDDGELVLENQVGRFFQYRIDLSGSAKDQPSVDLVRVFYAKPNSAPLVKSITVDIPKEKPKDPLAAATRPPTGRIDVFPNSNNANFDVTWQAEDPDADLLRFDLSIRPVTSPDWQLVEKDITGTKFPLEVRSLPDGEYRARIVARDSASNADGQDKRAELESSIFLVDNTAPALKLQKSDRASDGGVTLHWQASDKASLIAAAAWRPALEDFRLLQPDDELFDQKAETLTIRLHGDEAKKGTLVTIAVTDETGNTTLESVTLE